MKISFLTWFLNWLRLPVLALVTMLLTVLLHTLLGFLNPVMAITTSVIAPYGQSEEFQTLSQLDDTQYFVQRGRDHYKKEQFYEAASLWSIAEKQFAKQRDFLNQVMTLSNLALAYRQLGQWSKAEQAINQSLQLLEGVQSLTAPGLRIYAQALNTQGSLYLAQGQAEQALAAWQQATEIYTQADYPEGIVKSLINQTHALRNLGFFRESRSRLSQVEALLVEQTDLPLKIAFTQSLGETQRLIGDLKASQVSLEQSLQLAAMSSSKPKELAITRLSLGNTLQVRAQRQETFAQRTQEEKDWEKVEQLYRQALDTYAQISDEAPLLIQIQAKLNQLDISIHHKDWATVHSLRTFLRSEISALPLSRASAFSHMRFANLLLDACSTDCSSELKDSKKQAYTLLLAAKKQAEDLRDPIAESYALGYLGHLYEVQERFVDAQQLTEMAAQLARHQPSLTYQWEWQLGRVENKLKLGRESVLSHYETAFQKVQTVRSDLLHIGPDVQFDFRNDIEPLYREYISLLLPKDDRQFYNDPTQLIRAQTVIDDLRVAELESFLACGLIEPNDNIPRASIQQIADIDKTTAIIYPIILPDGPGAERIEVLVQLPEKNSAQVIKRYSPKVLRNSLSDMQNADVNASSFSDIEARLQKFRRQLESPYDYVLSESDQQIAAEIYDWLIRPAEEEGWLDSMETLVFVLDGVFRNVPMAALYDQQTQQFLIEKYAIATTFGDLEIPQAQPEKTFSVLAAGLSSPSYLPAASDSDSNVFADNAKFFEQLSFVEQELTSIQEIIDGTEPLLNEAFQKKTVQTEMSSSDYNIAHFATHGVFGFTRDDTFLLVAAPAASSQNPEEPRRQQIEVGKIDLNDFDSLLQTRNQTPLELLVLSACETATGDSREVLGIAGLAVQSGARSTLATLWSINDSSTSMLIKTFYEQLVHQGVSKAKALQKSQIELLRQNLHPSKWAPYLLVGDWR